MTSSTPEPLNLSVPESLLRFVVDRAPIVLYATDASGTIILSRGQALEPLGLSESELVGQSIFDLYRDEPRVAEAARRALNGETVTSSLVLGELMHETTMAPIAVPGGEVQGLVGVSFDSTARTLAEQQYQHAMTIDSATGLPNRTHFMRLAQEQIEESARLTRACWLYVIQISAYRPVAETFGYAIADTLLQEVGQRLRAISSPAAFLGRLTGGRFAVLLNDPGPLTGSGDFATHALAVLRAPFFLNDLRVDAQPQIGISLFPGHGDNADLLIRHAEVAARTAVSGVATYSLSWQSEQAANFRLLGDLQDALRHESIVVHYQPLVNTQTGEVHSVEALARWQHDEFGWVSPERFVGLAEGSGLIRPLTRYILNAVVRQAYAWQRDGLKLRVALNVSPHDLRDPAFVEDVEQALASWGVDPSQITVEVTERAAMDDASIALEQLHRIERLGIHLAIDDFGTGHSSLVRLKTLPFGTVKVDRSFVTNIAKNDADRAIVGAVISLTRALRRDVVAEGVETAAECDQLRVMGCPLIQGYFVSRPLQASHVRPWVDRGAWTDGVVD